MLINRVVRLLGLSLLVLSIAGVPTSVALAQDETEWVPGKYMIQAVGEMLDAADTLQTKLGYGYAEGACMVGTLLEPRAEYNMTRQFEKGVQYAIVAGGDEDATDIDVVISDENGNVIISDDSEERLGVVEWTPNTTGTYQIKVKLFEARQQSFCAFTILRKGGYTVPLQTAIDAAGKFFGDCNVIVNQVSGNGTTVGFLSGDGQAGLWGCILPKGESLTMTNVVPGSGTAVMMGRGNDDNVDIDIFVSRGSTEIGNDIADDSYPRYVGEFKAGVAYSVMLKNVDESDEIAFVVGGVLKVFNE